MQPGLSASLEFTVGDQDTALALGSGDLPVLGTPRVLAWLEQATCAAVAGAVGDGRSSVGTRVSLEHLAASAVGSTVRAEATLVHVDGRLLRFQVAATDAGTGALLASGEVSRVVVERDRFLARAGAAG